MTRYGVSLAPAMLLTFALFWIMQSLVSVGFQLIDARPPVPVNWVRLIPDTTPKPKPFKPPPLVKPTPPPPAPRIPRSITEIGPGANPLPYVPPGEDGDGLDRFHEAGGSDRDVVALMRPEPDYPASAETRGISGWVQLEFTVTRTGLVQGARIVSSRPAQIFDGAALTAIKRWRYKPRIVAGQAVDTPGVKVVLEFRP